MDHERVEATFDAIVIGAGPAGETVAGRLARAGRSTAIVEQELVGGECAYYACMPSKALLRPGQALAELRRVPGTAESVPGDLDADAVFAQRDVVVAGGDDAGQIPWLDDHGVTLLRGHGRLEGERCVTVDGRRYAATECVVIATGSAAVLPDIPGLAEARPWTNREATTGSRVPARLTVLGGGVSGIELADAYQSLGAEVTVLVRGGRLLPRVEEFAARELHASFADRGIQVRFHSEVTRFRRRGETVTASLSDGTDVVGDELLVAVGRRPRTDDLGLETLGLTPGDTLPVDERLRVPRRPWLYAIGDVNGHALLTHAGKHQARIAADVILGRQLMPIDAFEGPPQVIFTEPQIATVGLTLDAALARDIDAHAYDVPTSSTAGASFVGRGTAGTSRIVVDERRGRLVGATFVGVDVAEWLHAATIAIAGSVSIAELRTAVPAFPTRSEIWVELLDAREQARSRATT